MVDVTLFAFSAAFLFSISTVFSKFLIDDFKNPFKLLKYQMIVHWIFTFVFLFISLLIGIDILNNVTFESFSLIALSSIFIFIGFILFYFGLIFGNTSVAGIMNSPRAFMSVLIAFFLFNEQFKLEYYIWILAIIIGVFLVSWSSELRIKDILLFKANGSGIFLLSVAFWIFSDIFIRYLNNTVALATMLVIRFGCIVIMSSLSYPYLTKLTNEKFKTNYTINSPSFRSIIKVIIYITCFSMADLLITFSLGESLTITESMGILQSVMVFIIIVILSQYSKFRDVLKEEMDHKTLLIRSVGIVVSLMGAWNIIT